MDYITCHGSPKALSLGVFAIHINVRFIFLKPDEFSSSAKSPGNDFQQLIVWKKYFLSSIFNALPSFSDYENRSSQSACFISQCILHTSVATYGITILWRLLRIVSRKICSGLKAENDRRISNKCKSKANNIGAAMLISFSLRWIHLMPLFLMKLPQALLPATAACAAIWGLCWKTEDHIAVKKDRPRVWHIVLSVFGWPLQRGLLDRLFLSPPTSLDMSVKCVLHMHSCNLFLHLYSICLQQILKTLPGLPHLYALNLALSCFMERLL